MKKYALRDIGLVILAVFVITIIAYPLVFNPAKRPAEVAPMPAKIQQ